jgi:lysophospholipase L1-like esterase
MVIKPGRVGFSYTDAARDRFDQENSEIIASEQYPSVVFFGDSLLWYMPLKREPVAWSAVNRGIPGDVSLYMVRRFAADVLQLRPDKVVILAGVNDIINVLLGDAPYEKVTVDEAIAAICANITTMAQQAADARIEVYIGSVLPLETPMGKAVDNTRANDAIKRVNTYVQALCAEAGYHYIDFHSVFVDETTQCLKQEYSVDGVHLKKSGYRLFIDLLRAFLD